MQSENTTDMGTGKENQNRKIWPMSDLMDFDFPPVPWIIDSLLPSGLTILFGSPKLGKSWFVLSLAAAVSTGDHVLGKIKVPEREVLVLSLEDPPRRLKDRLVQINAKYSTKCHFATEWPRGPAGIARLHSWMRDHPETKLVIIDTWGRFTSVKDGNDYNQTVNAAAEMKCFADKYDLAVLAVHHVRKGPTEDFLNAAMGSVGLPATADTSMMLTRGRGDREAVLAITGRDVEEAEYALQFNTESMSWVLLGDKSEVQTSAARQGIYNLLLSNPDGMRPKQIAEELE